jgi:hypothetical protein
MRFSPHSLPFHDWLTIRACIRPSLVDAITPRSDISRKPLSANFARVAADLMDGIAVFGAKLDENQIPEAPDPT